ncbi:MAG: hypothetical protein HQ582_28395 [Planctomycetes bacterium]|nr:hypothetical protein [Planctomycetota bacterium]
MSGDDSTLGRALSWSGGRRDRGPRAKRRPGTVLPPLVQRVVPGLLAALVSVLAFSAPGESSPPKQNDGAVEEKTSDPAAEFRPEQPGEPGTRRAIIICGHPGSEAYREVYGQTVEKIYAALIRRYGFSAEDLWVRFGGDPREDDGAAVTASRGLSTREAIAADAVELGEVLRPEDALWVIVVGHAHFDGRHSFLNLPGPDIHEEEFGKLFDGLHSREQVFFVTMPASGYWIKHLSAKGRIVITATEADLEVNETLFHLDLAEVLDNPPEVKEYDQDGDGRVTVLDLYLNVVRRVMLRYKAEEEIPTEHAQLDDNGDHRGTEIQLDYLEPELGGGAEEGSRPEIRPTADGALAATWQVLARVERSKQ